MAYLGLNDGMKEGACLITYAIKSGRKTEKCI